MSQPNMPSCLKRKLGHSDIFIHPIGFGTWPLSRQGRPTESEAIKVLLAALDAGIDFIDTADAYCLEQNESGYSERMIAKALSLRKQAMPVIATKGGCIRPHGTWEMSGSRKHLLKACDASLKALQMDCIDLYQLHAPDKNVPWSETIDALAHLKKTGKIRHIGLCNVSLQEIRQAQAITEITSIQNQCNPFDLSAFHEGIVSYCGENNISFIAYSPVNGPYHHHLTAQHPVLAGIAKAHEISAYQVALAWLLEISDHLIAIPGTTKIENVLSNYKAMDVSLTPDQIRRLNEAFSLKE